MNTPMSIPPEGIPNTTPTGGPNSSASNKSPMSGHHHLSPEEIFELVNEGRPQDGLLGCDLCRSEALSVTALLSDLRREDQETANVTEWDGVLLRSRIRQAVAREKPHSRSLFDRFFILRPVFASALVAGLAFVLWTPFSIESGSGAHEAEHLASDQSTPGSSAGHLPAWIPLPREADDEGLAVLAEWTPNEDELDVVSCRSACLGGLSIQEEDALRAALATTAPNPLTEGTPL